MLQYSLSLQQPETRSFWLFVLLLLLPAVPLTMAGCSKAPVGDDLSTHNYRFVMETGDSVSFPSSFAGKMLVASYIYTHCPDICILTTSNMEELRKRIGNNDDVVFLSVSIDPRRDSPEVLREYAAIRDINTRSWHFLTSNKITTDSLLERVGFYYRRSFMEHSDTGEEIYFIDHSDFITLFDKHGRTRGTYEGTTLDIEDIVQDINAVAGEK